VSELRQVEWLEIQCLADSRGTLSLIESAVIPFTPARFFFTSVEGENRERGGHSHKECWQLLFCLSGQVDVHVVTTNSTKNYGLSQDGRALLVPPGIWCKQVFRDVNSVLGVIASHPYDAMDYVYEII
jgi:hypothetical protein